MLDSLYLTFDELCAAAQDESAFMIRILEVIHL